MMDDPEVIASEAIIDNGRFGQRTVRFETGLLAQQAAGSALAYLDDQTTVLSATTVGKNPRDQFDFFPLTVNMRPDASPETSSGGKAVPAPKQFWLLAKSTVRCAPPS